MMTRTLADEEKRQTQRDRTETVQFSASLKVVNSFVLNDKSSYMKGLRRM